MTNRLFSFAASVVMLAGAAFGTTKPGNVVFFGDSLTAGYGLNPDEAYPARIQEKIDKAGLPFHVVNAGLSGETTAGGLRRADWVLKQPMAVFILALGGNDGLRGLPVASTEANLKAIIRKVRSKRPHAAIILAGMEAPPNMGPDFTAKFRAVYPRVAREEHVKLIPFLLAGVGGVADLNQVDGIHPNVRGARIVADDVWMILEPVLQARVSANNQPAR